MGPSTPDAATPRDALARALEGREDLLPAAAALFDYAQYLLDDDERLTKGGALDGEGRERLKARAIELLGGPPRAAPSAAAEEADG